MLFGYFNVHASYAPCPLHYKLELGDYSPQALEETLQKEQKLEEKQIFIQQTLANTQDSDLVFSRLSSSFYRGKRSNECSYRKADEEGLILTVVETPEQFKVVLTKEYGLESENKDMHISDNEILFEQSFSKDVQTSNKSFQIEASTAIKSHFGFKYNCESLEGCPAGKDEMTVLGHFNDGFELKSLE